jgi:hypothetical protein
MDFLVRPSLEDLRALGFLSEPVSHEQIGNSLSTDGFDLGILDEDQVFDNSVAHLRSSTSRSPSIPPAADGREGSSLQVDEETPDSNPISLLPSANLEGMGFGLNPRDGQNGMEHYHSGNMEHTLGQAEDDSTTSIGDLSGEIEMFRLR